VEISEVKFIGRPKYLNSQMTRAKEKISFVLNGQKIERTADIRMIGNWSPAWVNVAGKSWQIDNYKLTRFEDVDTIA
jgi:P pilus assembly chaperone PapD